MDDEALAAMLYLDALSCALVRARNFYGCYGDQILHDIEPVRHQAAIWLRQTVAARRLDALGDPDQLPLPYRPPLCDRELLTFLREWTG